MTSVKSILKQSFAYELLTNPIYRARARAFDLKHNVDTAREVHLSELEIDSPSLAAGVFYAGTDAKFFRRFLNEWDIRFDDFVFVDLGSGKGRAMLIASEHPFKKIIGVEFSAELDQIARNNILSFKTPHQKCRNIESICQDAAIFRIPEEPVVIYMFNPFRREVISTVLKNLEDSYRKVPREIYIFYANPLHNDLIEQSPIFEQISSSEWHCMHKSVPV